MNFIFGEFSEKTDLSSQEINHILSLARQRKERLFNTPLNQIISVLAKVGELWRQDSKSGYYERALEELSQEISFSREMIQLSLDLLPQILDPNALENRVLSDFGNLNCLDRFSKRGSYEGSEKFVPHGVLLHVSAGNIFLGAIDSLILGFLTKNVSIVKLSSKNQTFPHLFAESLLKADPEGLLSQAFAFVHWRGGDSHYEDVFKNHVDAIIAWGGGEMVLTYKRNLKEGVAFIEHGPKFSFQVISQKGLEQTDLQTVSKNITRDLCLWDQSACSSPQNMFVQEGIDVDALMKAVAHELDKNPLPRGQVRQEESVELLKEEQRAVMTKAEGNGRGIKTKDAFLHYDPRPGIRISPLNRTLIIKKYNDREDLSNQLQPAAKSLQSCGYLLASTEKEIYLNGLSQLGVTRFSSIGKMLEGMEGGPHDGRLSLMELGRLVCDEGGGDFVNSETSLVKNADVTSHFRKPGYLFSSGGTTGNPKYVFYSNEEFDHTAQMIAKGFVKQGLKKGEVCANLFVAGNMWSSFIVVEKALSVTQATQLPIGGLAEPSLILFYLQKFKPDAVFGLPSILVELALRTEKENINIEIPKVFYAGEHLTEQGRRVLAKVWKVKKIGSAGYATVDAGPIGYQCSHTQPREYHLYEGQVHLDIIEGEGVVTSLVRKEMPVMNVHVGDHLEWVKNNKGCLCGSGDKKFILHGRIDGQMRIWSSRILWEEVEESFIKSGIQAPVIQILLEDPDMMTIRIETTQTLKQGDLTKFRNCFYQSCRDLAATQSREYLDTRLRLEVVKLGKLPHIERTQKIKPIVDKRII